MLPIGDHDTRGRKAAVVTWTIIAANILVFIFYQHFGRDVRATMSLALVPAELSEGRGFLALITSQFAHAGFVHIAGNMLFLSIFGDNVECRIGRLRYALLYILAGTVGLLAHAAAALLSGGAAAQAPMVGASAAISAVMAAYVVLFPGNRIVVLLFNFIPTALSAWIVIGAWFVLQVAGGLSGVSAGGTAYLAHIGGFASAWLWARFYRKREKARIEAERKERLVSGESGGVRWWIVDGENEDRR